MTHHYVLDRIAGRDGNLRAADADRERVGERLRTSHAEGRLDLSEFQHRLERCYESKTLGELDELVRDLPREDGDRNHSLVRLRPWRLAYLAPILIAVMLISAATEHHVFWLWIPLLFLVFRASWWRRRRWPAGTRRGPGDWI